MTVAWLLTYALGSGISTVKYAIAKPITPTTKPAPMVINANRLIFSRFNATTKGYRLAIPPHLRWFAACVAVSE